MLGTNVVPDKGYDLDWDNAQVIPASSINNYVVQKGGWIVGNFLNDNVQTCTLYVNGIPVSKSNYMANAWLSTANVGVEVKKGDVLTINNSQLTSSSTIYFVPYLHPMFIKAVIGPIGSSEADQVVQTIKQNLIKTVEVQITTQSDGYFWGDLPVDTAKILNVQVLSTTTSSNIGVVLSRGYNGTKTGLRFFATADFSSKNGTFTVLIAYLDN
jgi:hypothetical protein